VQLQKYCRGSLLRSLTEHTECHVGEYPFTRRSEAGYACAVCGAETKSSSRNPEDATLSSLAAMMNALGVIPKNDFKNHLILER
jgi:hypothetical protein